MWIYRKEIITIKDTDYPKDIVDEMNKFGEDGWEIFSICEKDEEYTRYGCVYKITCYTLYMKKSTE